jgi:hypothetical protein
MSCLRIVNLTFPIALRLELGIDSVPGVRDELKGQNLSFTEIAQLVGARWKVLDPEKKEMYEYEASAAKDKFNAEFEEYKKTESYAQYVKYLNDFKSKLAKDGKEIAGEFALGHTFTPPHYLTMLNG